MDNNSKSCPKCGSTDVIISTEFHWWQCLKCLKYGYTDSSKRRKAQRGQGLVEYALIIALVAIVVVAVLVIMGPQIGQIFSSITGGL